MKRTFLTVLILSFLSCTTSFTDLNSDPKNVEIVPSAFLLSNASYKLFDFMADPNSLKNNFRIHSRHWAETTYDEVSEEVILAVNSKNTFETMYVGVLRDLSEARKSVEIENMFEDQKRSFIAVVDIFEVLCYSILVDLYGDVPFTQALSSEFYPEYDDAQNIYFTIIEDLKEAILELEDSTHNIEGDLVYNGDVNSWIRFGNSLLLKLAIRIADQNDAKAQEIVEYAFQSGLMESSEDDFELVFKDNSTYPNPLWVHLVERRRTEFVCAKSLADAMNSTEDPRRPYYFKNLGENDELIGGINGVVNSYPANSQPGSLLEDPTWPGKIMTHTELLFLLADAAARAYNVGESAAYYYHEAIRNSILEWGGSEMQADAYLENTLVNYHTAQGSWKQKIAVQKWIAMYDVPVEAWSTYRLYDWPDLPDELGSQFPVINRYTYPESELDLNSENVREAIERMGGEDLFTYKIFWDIY